MTEETKMILELIEDERADVQSRIKLYSTNEGGLLVESHAEELVTLYQAVDNTLMMLEGRIRRRLK